MMRSLAVGLQGERRSVRRNECRERGSVVVWWCGVEDKKTNRIGTEEGEEQEQEEAGSAQLRRDKACGTPGSALGRCSQLSGTRRRGHTASSLNRNQPRAAVAVDFTAYPPFFPPGRPPKAANLLDRPPV